MMIPVDMIVLIYTSINQNQPNNICMILTLPVIFDSATASPFRCELQPTFSNIPNCRLVRGNVIKRLLNIFEYRSQGLTQFLQ
jgi:hypothetical protein